jgi:hypothetical protein
MHGATLKKKYNIYLGRSKLVKPMLIKSFIYAVIEWNLKNLSLFSKIIRVRSSEICHTLGKSWFTNSSSFITKSLKIKRWWFSA